MSDSNFRKHGIPYYERCRECEAKHAPEAQEQPPMILSAQ
jgi:hypothetical protein